MKIIQQRPNLRQVMLTHRQTNVEYVDFLTADTELHTDSSMTKLDVFTHIIRSLYHTKSSALVWLHILNWVRGSERLNLLISGFHRALLESIIFIIRLMHSIIQNVEVNIYVLYKSLKDTKLKITLTCFGYHVIHHQGVQSFA